MKLRNSAFDGPALHGREEKERGTQKYLPIEVKSSAQGPRGYGHMDV
jgi:hypothetical protein